MRSNLHLHKKYALDSATDQRKESKGLRAASAAAGHRKGATHTSEHDVKTMKTFQSVQPIITWINAGRRTHWNSLTTKETLSKGDATLHTSMSPIATLLSAFLGCAELQPHHTVHVCGGDCTRWQRGRWCRRRLAFDRCDSWHGARLYLQHQCEHVVYFLL